MSEELSKIDIIRTRLGIDYEEAKAALDLAEGNVVDALINLENRKFRLANCIYSAGQETVEQLKNIMCKTRQYQLRVRQGEQVVCELPASLAVLGLAAIIARKELAVLGVLGTLAAMANIYTLEVLNRAETGLEG